jgi:hypothetical protein
MQVRAKNEILSDTGDRYTEMREHLAHMPIFQDEFIVLNQTIPVFKYQQK